MLSVFVLLRFPSLEVVEKVYHVGPVPLPYIPGLLSFRESPNLLLAYEKLRQRPDIIMVDGHGIAHPRRMGIAAHLGRRTGCSDVWSSQATPYRPLRGAGPHQGQHHAPHRQKRRAVGRSHPQQRQRKAAVREPRPPLRPGKRLPGSPWPACAATSSPSPPASPTTGPRSSKWKYANAGPVSGRGATLCGAASEPRPALLLQRLPAPPQTARGRFACALPAGSGNGTAGSG